MEVYSIKKKFIFFLVFGYCIYNWDMLKIEDLSWMATLFYQILVFSERW